MSIVTDIKQLKKNLSKYIKFFKEEDEDLKLRRRLIGTAAYNNFIQYNSSPRGYMMTSHMSQILVLEEPDVKIIRSGMEEDFSISAIKIEAEKDYTVEAVIKRYKDGLGKYDIGKVVAYVIIVKDDDGVIDAIEIPYFERNHPYFGFKYNVDKEFIEGLMPGDIIPKGKVLAWPNTYKKDRNTYGFGKNLNVAFMTVEGVDEDGFIISESAAKKLRFRLYERRSITTGKNSFLLNIYGDDENYKPFPEIGEYINETGAVVARRKYDNKLAPALYSKEDVKEFNPIFDKVAYVRGAGGKVVDIKVYKQPHKKIMLPKNTDILLEKYANALIGFHRDIVNVYENIVKSNKFNKPRFGNNFTRLVLESLTIVNSSDNNTKIKKMYRKEELDLYYAEFDIEYLITPTIGYKLTGLAGDKGVIVRIWPDEDMPVDEEGNRADLIMDPNSTVSRVNISRLYERYFGAASRKARNYVINRIKDFIGELDISKLTNKQIKTIWTEEVLEFVKLFENEQYDIYSNATIEEMKETLQEIIDYEFYIYFPVENEKRAYEVVLDIEESKFKPVYKPVRYKDQQTGKYITTKNPIMIAPMHIMLLNRIADDALTCASAKVNHFGLPITVSKIDKYDLPYRNSPVRVVSETEGRLYASYGGRELTAEIMDRAANLDTHEVIYENVLKSEQPTNIDVIVDRTKYPYKSTKALEIWNTFLNTGGFEISFTEDKRRYIYPIKENEKNKVHIDINKSDTIEE